MAITKSTVFNNATNGANGPDYGRRLLPHVVDDIAATDPGRECFSIPRTSDPKDGWRTVTWKQYANAINYVARRIVDNCGTAAPGKFPTIAYVGYNDARYVVLVLATIKAGYKALLLSPRNSHEGQMSLLERTDCHIFAFPRSHRKIVEPWVQERNMQAVEVGELDSWFPETDDVEPFPYTKTFDEAEWEPLVVLHTSGSTGIPKPIVVRQGMLAIADKYHVIPEWKGRKHFLFAFSEDSRRNFFTMPLFHAAGMFAFLASTVYFNTPTAFGLPDRPVSAESVAQCLSVLDVGATLLPPAILEDMSQNNEHIEILKKLNRVYFAGGNLIKDAGNRLVDHGVHVCNAISATEFFPFPIFVQPDDKLWQYLIINSDDLGADWRKVQGEENVYQLISVRKEKAPGLQGFFYTFPELDEYDTKDLYKPHPTLPDHWLHCGRSDNIVVFSNGEKLNPVTIEDTVSDHPELHGALVVGHGRFQASLLLEPITYPKTESETEALIDRVWPLVVAANKETVAHGQIGRKFILLASPEKPFLRAAKGTIQKAGTLKLYQAEIDEFYEKSEQVSEVDAPKLDLSSVESLTESILDLFHGKIGIQQELPPDADFFSCGIDSMQVISASRLLHAGLKAAGYHINADTVATRVIYGNPTPERLSKYILSHIGQDGVTATDSEGAEREAESSKLLWQKYTEDLPKAKPGRPDPSNTEQTVILTGSTGMLGSYMLDLMVKNPKVKRVICLNRADDGGRKRQVPIMKERGLVSDYETKCTFLHVDMSRSDFGLPRETFDELLSTADRFIHNAWPVNFNIPVESFEPHIRGTRNVADFATRSAKRVAVTFISSIGTGDLWDAKSGLLPESRLEDLTLPSGGYGRSKQVGSLVLEDVARGGGDFPAAVVRVGQIAGPEAEAGVWNKQEWLPSIIASSLYLGALPRELGSMERVDWTAAESIAGLVLDVAGVAQEVPVGEISGYYHGVNPSSTTWSELAPVVQEFYGKDRIRELISFGEWIERLDKSQENADIQSLDKNPGVKLIDSYRGMAGAATVEGWQPVVFDMKLTKERSPSMRNAKAVTAELMRNWCRQWNF